MSFPESPAMTDAEEIKYEIRNSQEQLAEINARLDTYRDAINIMGANLQWLVDNTKGLFQVFSSPAFMSQMSNMMMGQINGGQSGSENTDGPTSGPDT